MMYLDDRDMLEMVVGVLASEVASAGKTGGSLGSSCAFGSLQSFVRWVGEVSS